MEGSGEVGSRGGTGELIFDFSRGLGLSRDWKSGESLRCRIAAFLPPIFYISLYGIRKLKGEIEIVGIFPRNYSGALPNLVPCGLFLFLSLSAFPTIHFEIKKKKRTGNNTIFIPGGRISETYVNKACPPPSAQPHTEVVISLPPRKNKRILLCLRIILWFSLFQEKSMEIDNFITFQLVLMLEPLLKKQRVLGKTAQ